MTSSDSRTDRDHDDVTEMRWCASRCVRHHFQVTSGHSAEQIVAWVREAGGEARYVPEIDTFVWGYRPARILVRQADGTDAPVAPGDTIVKGGEWIGHVGEEFVGVREFTVRQSS